MMNVTHWIFVFIDVLPPLPPRILPLPGFIPRAA